LFQGRGAQPQRPVGTRNVSRSSVASTLPSLLDMPLSQKSRSASSGLLGKIYSDFYYKKKNFMQH